MMIIEAQYFRKIILFLLIFVSAKCDSQNEEELEKLAAKLTVPKSVTHDRDVNDGLKIWEEYEFGTGVGNREELIVTRIYIEDSQALPINGVQNWQFSSGILAGSGESSIRVYFHANKDGGVHDRAVLTATGTILTFKVINLLNPTTNVEDIILVSCVEYNSEIKLNWYKIVSGDFEPIWSSIVARRVERIDFFQQRGKNKLLLVHEPINYEDAVYSSIEIYGFSFMEGLFDFWLCQRIFIPQISGVELCSIYESTFLSIRSRNTVSLYEFKENEPKEGLFELSQNFTLNGLKNSACFENGYTEYLALSGPESALFTFVENEFLYDKKMERLFTDLGETTWVQCLPVQTYREECLLLIQLKNLTVIGLSWRGESFEITALPEFNIDNFELSKITVIPNYGFIFDNKLVKVETRLRDLPRPMDYQMAKVLELKNSLEAIFLEQEFILDETERRIQNSFYANPVITGFWNLSEVNTGTAIISAEVPYDSLSVGSKLFTELDVASNLTLFDEQLRNLDQKMEKIGQISRVAVPKNSPDVQIAGFLLDGGIEVLGTLHVKNLTFESLNGFALDDIINDFVKSDKDSVIKGSKSFPSIEADRINIVRINGVPLADVIFDNEKKNYENIDFGKLNELVVNGSMNFSTINGFDWEDLMKSVVWKNRPAVIPGSTVVLGEIIADYVSASTLNGLKYPGEYVMQNVTDPAEISGHKTFGDVRVGNLKGIKTINGISYQDFVTLNTEQTLPREITFNDLIIDESLQIDGRITGVEVNQEEHRLTLNDVKVITADTMFANLHVTGNIIVQNSVNKKTLSDFDDILRKSEKNAVINGQKNFLGNVRIESKLIVTSKKYNGHAIDEFVTLSSEQVFPNLKKISAPVTFENLEYKQLTDLQNYFEELIDDNGDSKCSNQKLTFNVTPIFEDIAFRTLNGNISALYFSDKFFQTFQNLNFENLEVKRLYSGVVTPVKINGVILSDFENRRISISTPQILTGNYTIEYLKAGELKTEYINGMSLNELEKFRDDFEDLFDRIWNGKMIIDTFIVKGRVQTNTINGQLLAEIYARNELRNVIVSDGFYAGKLEVYGLVNGINLTDYALDSVFKTDRNVLLTGQKIVDNLNSEILEFVMLNGSPVQEIVNSNLAQTLTGPILVKGTVVVENSFNCDGRVNDLPYKQLTDRISYLGNDTFELRGDFRFLDDAVIKNLHIDGPVRGITFKSFMDTVIFQGDDIDISGTKIFTNSVTFRDNFTIINEYNGLDLTMFNHHAILIDKNVHIDSELIFQEDLIIAGDLRVQERLDSQTIANVDIEELKSSAIFLDRPSYVPGTLTFTNATFESGMKVHYLNDIDLNAVIPLKGDQLIFRALSFSNVSVDTLGTIRSVNGYDMNKIFASTFMLSGNQTLTGNLIFHGNVEMKNDFDPRSMNGVDTAQMISLDEDEKLIGTFEFRSPLILRKDFRVFGLVNDIDLARWESEAVYDSFPKRQLVSGDWLIRGNVSFDKDVIGSGLLDGTDVQRLSDELEKRNMVIDSTVSGVKVDLESTCKDLRPLQKYAKNQIHRFKFFEYFQIINFDVAIKSVHHFDADDDEYLLINLEQCFLNIFVYNGSGFTIASSEHDFDAVEKWSTLKYEDQVYLVTLGNGMCGKSYGNLWKFDEQKLTHILDLGSITDVKKIGDYDFLVISEKRLEKWSIKDVHKGLYGNLTSYFSTNEHMRFVPNTERVLMVEYDYIHEFHPQYSNHTSLFNHFGNGAVISLQAGIFRTDMFLYYDEGVSENNAFIFDGLSERKIRQGIPTHKPTSFLIINFDSLVETFLTFVKNGRSLEIFEYRGIEGFVYRESIKMLIDKTFGFKLRKHPGLSKKNYVGAIYGNTLTILEAKMYGEKLDVEYLICQD